MRVGALIFYQGLNNSFILMFVKATYDERIRKEVM